MINGDLGCGSGSGGETCLKQQDARCVDRLLNCYNSVSCGYKSGGGGNSGGSGSTGQCSDYCTSPSQCSSQGGYVVGKPCSFSSCSSGSPCLIGSSGGGGSPSTTLPPKKKSVCGENCTSYLDCQTPEKGLKPACYQGKCANPACPSTTIQGLMCACSSVPGPISTAGPR